MQRRLCLYYRTPPEQNRWVWGDRYVRPVVRRLIRGQPRMGGVEKVFRNLCLGLDKLGIEYEVNLPFHSLRPEDRVAVLGRGRSCLNGYACSNPIVAGIGLMTHPAEWPTLCTDYPVVRYLQHSKWCSDIYRPYFGDRCGVWAVGIDSATWTPSDGGKDIDFLIYDKVHWERDRHQKDLIGPIQEILARDHLTSATIRYGTYEEAQYRQLLKRSKAMIYLSEHESQGLAYQECLSSNVPILAWDQGFCVDPDQLQYEKNALPASSVPYFDHRCGRKFGAAHEFDDALGRFLADMRQDRFAPREYILDNLTLEACSQRFVDILMRDIV